MMTTLLKDEHLVRAPPFLTTMYSVPAGRARLVSLLGISLCHLETEVWSDRLTACSQGECSLSCTSNLNITVTGQAAAGSTLFFFYQAITGQHQQAALIYPRGDRAPRILWSYQCTAQNQSTLGSWVHICRNSAQLNSC